MKILTGCQWIGLSPEMSKITSTHTGFVCVDFDDLHANKCTLQKSSATLYDAVWLGIASPEINIMIDGGWKALAIPEGAAVNSRMHLSQKMIRDLLPLLQHFADTGELPET
jgi:hypothetical protein